MPFSEILSIHISNVDELSVVEESWLHTSVADFLHDLVSIFRQYLTPQWRYGQGDGINR